MRAFDDESVYPRPPYQGGRYVIGLSRPANWYIRRATEKGKSFGTCNVKQIIPLIVEKLFDVAIDQEELDLALNLDCMIGTEADFVKQELEYLALAEIMAYFPNIASELPEDMYWITEKLELVINVPDLYEQQRGYFF